MKIGIMQPYFMPYIGYWQLINVVDRFVILDDVKYIMRGYINRNSILLNTKPFRFTIPIEKASQNKLIKETKIKFSDEKRKDFLLTLHNAYRKAPYYEETVSLVKDVIFNAEVDLTGFIRYSIDKIVKYLNISTDILLSSEINKNQMLKGESRIIEICKKLDADIYINPCGGKSLYNFDNFEKERMQLLFLNTKSECIFYDQGQKDFVNNLSIIDIMMFNDVETIQKFLTKYTLGR